MAALQYFVRLRFQRNSCYHVTKHYKICYFGGGFSVFSSKAAKLWLIQIQDICMGNDKTSLTLLSCFSQNSNVYNFLSNDNTTLKLHIMTHFDITFLGIQFFL